MKYALLIYGPEQGWAEASQPEREKVYVRYREFAQMLETRGAIRGGEELDLTSTATTVRHSGDDVMVTDGPFAETTEQLGGFLLIDAADLDEALGYAKALPASCVEVRPVVESSEPH